MGTFSNFAAGNPIWRCVFHLESLTLQIIVKSVQILHATPGSEYIALSIKRVLFANALQVAVTLHFPHNSFISRLAHPTATWHHARESDEAMRSLGHRSRDPATKYGANSCLVALVESSTFVAPTSSSCCARAMPTGFARDLHRTGILTRLSAVFCFVCQSILVTFESLTALFHPT